MPTVVVVNRSSGIRAATVRFKNISGVYTRASPMGSGHPQACRAPSDARFASRIPCNFRLTLRAQPVDPTLTNARDDSGARGAVPQINPEFLFGALLNPQRGVGAGTKCLRCPSLRISSIGLLILAQRCVAAVLKSRAATQAARYDCRQSPEAVQIPGPRKYSGYSRLSPVVRSSCDSARS